MLEHVELAASGFYECEVGASEQAGDDLAIVPAAHYQMTAAGLTSLNRGDKLRRVFGLLINGKYLKPDWKQRLLESLDR